MTSCFVKFFDIFERNYFIIKKLFGFYLLISLCVFFAATSLDFST